MQNLIIIGAGGCGREVLQWSRDANRAAPVYHIKGFLDDDPQALAGKDCDLPVIGTVTEYTPVPGDVFVCALGNPAIKRKAVERLQSRGAAFVNVIHPTAVVADSARLGTGVILYPFSIVSADAAVGDFCIVNMHSAVAHDACLGNHSTVSAFCDITGGCRLGEAVFLGTGVKLTPAVTVGDGAFICAGSVVFHPVKPGEKVLGNPARRLKI